MSANVADVDSIFTGSVSRKPMAASSEAREFFPTGDLSCFCFSKAHGREFRNDNHKQNNNPWPRVPKRRSQTKQQSTMSRRKRRTASLPSTRGGTFVSQFRKDGLLHNPVFKARADKIIFEIMKELDDLPINPETGSIYRGSAKKVLDKCLVLNYWLTRDMIHSKRNKHPRRKERPWRAILPKQNS